MNSNALSHEQILGAYERITPHVKKTPLLKSDYLSALVGGNVYLKLENLQRLGAFKIRGMINRVLTLTDAERERGIVVVSSGNHAISASYCGSVFGVEVTVYVPETTPSFKLQKIREYGAVLKTAGANYDECAIAVRKSPEYATKVFVDSGDDPGVLAGYGSIAYEIFESLPNPDFVMVPIGGGGLITGVGLTVKRHDRSIRVLGVQTEACPAMHRSLCDGICYERFPTDPSLCEALVGGISRLPYEFSKQSIDRVVLTSEAAIRKAVRALLAHDKVVSEPSGAVGVAYVMENHDVFSGKDTVIVISGGNIGLDLLAQEAAQLATDTE